MQSLSLSLILQNQLSKNLINGNPRGNPRGFKMNKYMHYSKAKSECDTITWKIYNDPLVNRWKVEFSDGEKRSFRHEKDAKAYINDKFFSMYF
jgi:hypothetical protein